MELDKPFFTSASLHREVVLPIDINAIEVVSYNKVSELIGGKNGIRAGSGRELSRSKCWDQDLFAGIIEGFSELFLDNLSIIRNPWEISSRIGPC